MKYSHQNILKVWQRHAFNGLHGCHTTKTVILPNANSFINHFSFIILARISYMPLPKRSAAGAVKCSWSLCSSASDMSTT